MNIKNICYCFFLCFVSITPILAQRDHIDISNYILCINSYAESAPWSNRMISAISEYVQKVPQLTLYAEHMNMLMIDTDTTLKEFKNLIQEKYSKHHPRLLVLLGNSAFYCCATNIENYGGYSYRIMFGRKLYRLTRSLYMQATDCKKPTVYHSLNWPIHTTWFIYTLTSIFRKTYN